MPHHLTGRALALLLGVVPLLVAATWLRLLLPVAGLYALVVLALLGWEWHRAPRAARFRVVRHHDSKLSLGAANVVRVTLDLFPPLARALPIVVRDEPPDEWASSALLHEGTLPAGAPLTLRYTVTPPTRGDYAFGDVTLRWGGPLRLLQWQHTFPSHAPVRVYPNLLEVRKFELLARSGRLWEMGLRRAQRFGRGTEFERLRDYTADDEYRRISWKATARRGKPIAVAYQTERSQTVFTLLDAGRLMRAPIGALAKLDYAINTVLLLGFVAGLRGDHVGNLTFADDILSYLPAKSGRAHFFRLLEQLYRVQSQPTVPDVRRAVAYLKARRPTRALVVLFTDLAPGSDMDELAVAMASLRPRHLPLVVTMADAGVLALAAQPPRNSAAVYERALAEQALEARRLLLDRLERRGVMTLDVPAPQLTTSVINRYLALKARALL